jgi:signal transduction histidine kinase
MRWRILVWMVVVTAIGVGLFAVPLGFALSDLYREEEVVRLERAASEATSDVPADFPRALGRIDVKEREKLIGVYDRAGHRREGAGPLRADPIVREALEGEPRDRDLGSRLVVAVPLTRGERIVGAVRASGPLSAVTDRVRGSFVNMVLAGAAAVVIASLVALWQSRRLARPVGRLAETAIALGEGDFTVREERSGIPEVDAVSHALEVTATRLDDMLQRERAFSADASHQLRTPLTGLRVTLEAAQLDPDVDPDAALETALGEIDRLERTIDDIVALARELPTQGTATDVTRTIESVTHEWQGRADVQRRTLQSASPVGLPRVAVSERAVRQILDVLVDNALRHGGGAVTIRARAAPAGVVVEVNDTGPGVRGDPERIFDRRVSHSGGTGIGLALARSLAEAEGGRLVLLDAGPGATFSLVLPRATNA